MHRRPAFAALVGSVTVALTLALSVPLASVAGGQSSEPVTTTTVVIEKRVVGPATGGSTVRLDCLQQGGGTVGVDFSFDAAGQPTTTDSFVGTVDKLDGAWRLVVTPETQGEPATQVCTFTETVTGGASATSWSCDYSNTPTPDPPADEVKLGCPAANGQGTGPFAVTYGFIGAGVATQTSTVRFTNTYLPKPPEPPATGPPAPAPAAVEKVPTFTG